MRFLATLLLTAVAFAQWPFTEAATVQKVAGGFQFTEGPCWRPDGVLLFSDVSGDTVYRFTAKGGTEIHHKPSGNSNGLALDAQGRLLLAQHGKRRVARLEADGTETALATHYGGKRLNSPNDIAVKSDGAIYFTDPPYGIGSSQEELGFYGLFRVSSDPEAPELLYRDMKRPNGVAFSPDESLLYVADTNDARVMVFDVSATGTLSTPRVFIEGQGELSPDGVEVDAAGNLYIAGTDGRIWVYSAAGGLLGSFAVPEKTRNLAWGDADGKTLYVTSGASVYRVRALPGATQYPETTFVPAGEFEMGDHHNFVDPAHPSDEVPIHRVWIDALIAGVYDVTNRQYVEFLNSANAQGSIEVRDGMVYRKGGADAFAETRQMSDYSSIDWDGKTFSVTGFRSTHPAVGIRWHGAAAYSNWLSEQEGLIPCYDTSTWKCDFAQNGYRLPSEAEWEYLARGGQYTPYRNFPWGDDADNTKANWPDSKDPFETGALPWTTPVGFYDGEVKNKGDFNWPGSQETYQTSNGSNGFGLYDMSGNIWQWCHDWYNRDYYSASPYKNPPGPDAASPMPDGKPYRVMRGGNWYNGDKSDPGHGRVSNRDPGYFRGPQDPNHPYYHVGFRVVRPSPALSLVSAASFDDTAVAPASIVTALGRGLAGGTVTVKDSAGVLRVAPVLFAAENQVNFVVPDTTAGGVATFCVLKGGQPAAGGVVMVEAVVPAIFSANASGKGVAAALAVRIGVSGAQTTTAVFQCGQTAGSCTGVPIDLVTGDEQVVLSLFGTGMRAGARQATATVGGTAVSVTGPVAQDQYAGLDQVNIGPLPRTLAGRGEVEILVAVNGKKANPVTVNIK